MGSLSCAAVFSDHMVLQQKKEIRIWGCAFSGWKVRARLLKDSLTKKDSADSGLSFSEEREIVSSEEVTVNYDKKWMLTLPPISAGGPYVLEVTAEGMDPYVISDHPVTNKKVFSDVMVGEVWLAGGQSNMELELRNSLNGKEILKSIKEDGRNVRFFYTKKLASFDDTFAWEERNNSWRTASEENSAVWSAVGYYFAKKLSDVLGVTVGVIGCNWGATSAANWVSEKDLEADDRLAVYLDEYHQSYDGDYLKYKEELDRYNAYQAIWQAKIDAIYAKNPNTKWEEALEIAGDCIWPGPMGPDSPYRPAGLYETMLKRIAPYTLKGFLYYQGEADEEKAAIYDVLMEKLIHRWRAEWMDEKLPFIFTQLPMYALTGEENDEKWPLLRLKQQEAADRLEGVELATALDLGEHNNIHPVEKKTIGERLCLKALKLAYKKAAKCEADCPRVISCNIDDDGSLVLFTENVEVGLIIKRSVDPKYDSVSHAPCYPDSSLGFEIAGEDQNYYPADSVKLDGEKIVISCSAVNTPVYVRYAWRAFAPVYVFGDNNLPLTPFCISLSR